MSSGREIELLMLVVTGGLATWSVVLAWRRDWSDLRTLWLRGPGFKPPLIVVVPIFGVLWLLFPMHHHEPRALYINGTVIHAVPSVTEDSETRSAVVEVLLDREPLRDSELSVLVSFGLARSAVKPVGFAVFRASGVETSEPSIQASINGRDLRLLLPRGSVPSGSCCWQVRLHDSTTGSDHPYFGRFPGA
jgi:hypothetical protein